MILLTSPNNPTGTALPIKDIQAILDVAPGVVVVDEAYGEFRRDSVPSAVTLMPRNPRLIVSRTLSKAFKFAGGRVGYCACAAAIAEPSSLSDYLITCLNLRRLRPAPRSLPVTKCCRRGDAKNRT